MQYSDHNTPFGHDTDHGPTGRGQYNSLGEYCGPHTAFSVFLILINSYMLGNIWNPSLGLHAGYPERSLILQT